MAPSAWDDEESDSTPPTSPSAPAVILRRGKFDDEEDNGDVLDSWDAAEDSEVEREKEKKAAEAKAKADALAKANHKSKSQRLEEKREERLRQKALDLDADSDDSEDESDRRARALAAEKEADLKNAEDLFGGVGGVPASRGAPKAITVQEGADPSDTIDLSSMKLFNPNTALAFNKLRETLVPLLNNNAKKPQYALFMGEFAKQIMKEMSSEQIKKVASGLTALSNEKLKEEKAAEKGGKKTKAAKNKTSLNANRNVGSMADTAAYDDGLDEDDFM
ncbi:related to HCR1 Component of translation initiation factor eIF3 [Ramularia collo-cygni]|uniref:Eukaryotic translation initiation factor 3 subunit J n=1 Tax=Ramularia collo-cygni TaxID=112498 RepID=A0A2D3V3R2_9PEZI|nr:related to HCR1 Component of translation initiation factor eIF3 [Ramularia collo-cygni]CZT18176.1 related to HCR1 Component of translation initiation factor eIF3 [Ramularia collo-cygni]